ALRACPHFPPHGPIPPAECRTPDARPRVRRLRDRSRCGGADGPHQRPTRVRAGPRIPSGAESCDGGAAMTAVPASRTLLADGDRRAARITRDNGTTYYWGTMLLPPERRRHVYAVYALCRLADDIVDAPSATMG